MNKEKDIATSEQNTLEKRVYTVEEIQSILNIGRNAAYKLVKSNAFYSVRIGNQYRISKLQFDRWLEERMDN